MIIYHDQVEVFLEHKVGLTLKTQLTEFIILRNEKTKTISSSQ